VQHGLINVRFAPIATKFTSASKRRDGPTADIEPHLQLKDATSARRFKNNINDFAAYLHTAHSAPDARCGGGLTPAVTVWLGGSWLPTHQRGALGIVALLRLETNHCRTGANHIEFACCGAAQIDNSATAIRPAIYNTHNDGFSVADVCDKHFRSKRQRAMRGGKPVWTGSFAAGGATAAIKCGYAGLGTGRTDRCRSQGDRQYEFARNHLY
jgi:hypothetical protein